MAAESKLEGKFNRAVRKAGGISIKMTPMGRSGWPDREVLMPGNRHYFVELKAPGKKPEPLQKEVIKELRTVWGCIVWVIDCEELINGFIKSITHE